jgi:hypothetical protein
VSDVDVRGDSLLDVAWKDYRGWAEASGALQRASRRQAISVLVITCAAAFFGALASIHWPNDGFILVTTSLAAAILVGIGTLLGRYILDANAQQQWIQARATAESIQSECYRYAARCGEYASKDAAQRFKDRIDAFSAAATSKGLFADAQARAAPPRRPAPAIDMTADWYRTNRLIEQRDWYQKRSGEHASTAGRLRNISFALGSVATALGAVSAAHIVNWVAPFVAMMTTVMTSVAAYGALGRQVYLAASYSEMASQVDRLVALNREGDLSDEKLVEAGEDLLSSEHRAWADRVALQEPRARRGAGSRRSRGSTAR